MGTIAGLLASADTVVDGVNRTIEQAFYLDGENSMIDSVEISHDTIFLILNGISNAKTLSYTPVSTYDDDSTVYSGPWILNSMGVGALTFYKYPIGEPDAQNVNTLAASNTSIKVIENNESEESLFINLDESGWTTVELVDVLGRVTQTIVDGWMDVGEHVFPINLHSIDGCRFAAMFTAGEILVTKLSPNP